MMAKLKRIQGWLRDIRIREFLNSAKLRPSSRQTSRLSYLGVPWPKSKSWFVPASVSWLTVKDLLW